MCPKNNCFRHLYCPSCAKPVASFNFSEANISSVEPLDEEVTRVRPTTAARNSSGSRWLFTAIGGIAILVLGVVLGVAIIGGSTYMNRDADKVNLPTAPKDIASKNSTTPNAKPTRSEELLAASPPANATNNATTNAANTFAPTAAPHDNPKILIVNDHIPVAARQYRWFRVQCDAACEIEGAFRVYGGSEDIDAAVLDELNFNAWQNGDQVPALYSTSRTARGRINVTTPPGRYVIVFSNRHALLTPKTVSAEIYYRLL